MQQKSNLLQNATDNVYIFKRFIILRNRLYGKINGSNFII